MKMPRERALERAALRVLARQTRTLIHWIALTVPTWVPEVDQCMDDCEKSCKRSDELLATPAAAGVSEKRKFGDLVRVEAQMRRPSQDFDPYAVKLADIVVFVGDEECACWFAKGLVDAVNARMSAPPSGEANERAKRYEKALEYIVILNNLYLGSSFSEGVKGGSNYAHVCDIASQMVDTAAFALADDPKGED